MPANHIELVEQGAPCPDEEVSGWSVMNLSLVTFLVLLGLSMVAPILPDYAASFQVNYTLVGFVVSSFALTRMILDMPAGLLSRRFDKRMIMALGLILLSGSSVMAGVAPDYLTLIVARMIEGAGSAMYVTSATVFLAQICGEEKRGQWMSLYMGMLLLGSIFGPTFGGLLAQVYDIRAPFFAYATITGLALIPTAVLPKVVYTEPASSDLKPPEILREIRAVLSSPSFLPVTFAVLIMFLLRTGVRSTLVPLFASNNLGLDSGSIGFILTIAGITTAITMTPIGRVSDRIGRKIPLAVCLVLTAVLILFVPSSTDFLSLAIVMAVYGLTVGLSGPSAAFVTDVSPQDKLEISMGLYRTISDFGFVLGPILLGFLADLTATPVAGASHSGLIGVVPFAVTSVLLLMGFVVLMTVKDPKRLGSD